MKLVSLELEGFTSFRSRTVVPFEGLELFAICGPTGAGKSSLLDAITFALYGRVERVGKQVSSLVSTGKGSLSVLLEFEAAGSRYRVARKLSVAGAQRQRVLFERADGDSWIDAGDGSDKVTPVNARIAEILGIDYTAFVRTVVLPQGEFARFLNGDAGERREILSNLLGFDVYERMRKRAGQLASTLRTEATAIAETVTRTLAHATPGALAALDADLESAVETADRLAETRKGVAELADRDASLAERLQSLDEARTVAADASGSHERLLEERAAATAAVDAARNALAAAGTAAAEAERDAAALRGELEADIAEAGDDAAVRKLRDDASAWARLGEELAALEVRIDAGREHTTRARETVAAAEREVEQAARRIEQARAEAGDAEAGLAAARRADHAAAACEGLGPGAPCPVCSVPLPDPLPLATSEALTAAQRVHAAATKALSVAEQAGAEADKALTAARATADAYEERLTSLAATVEETRSRLELHAAALAGAFGEVPSDPLAVLENRLALRDDLRRRIDAAERAAATARTGLERVREDERRAAEVLARFDGDLAALQGSYAAAIARLLPDEPAAVLDGAPTLLERLDASVADVRRERESLLARAVSLAGDLGAPDAGLQRVLETLDSRRRGLDEQLGRLRAQRENLETEIARRAGLDADVEAIGRRADAFKVIADELRSNNFVEYLQEEAMRSLCVAGSDHLERLSGGRYRLSYEDANFTVLDAWNANLSRPAKTLSGGETFLASLSLALSLAEEVARLRIAGAARLESLFLDEGFGTLDAGTLTEVEEALQRLAATGRTIGVITHIDALAERLPVRIDVSKDQAGSTVTITG